MVVSLATVGSVRSPSTTPTKNRWPAFFSKSFVRAVAAVDGHGRDDWEARNAAAARRAMVIDPEMSRRRKSTVAPLATEQGASSQMIEQSIDWRPLPPLSVSSLASIYKSLSKANLSTLVVLSAMAGYAMCPVTSATTTAAMDAFSSSLISNINLAPLPELAPNTLSVPVLLSTAVGTALCAASANTINQLIEYPYDAQMARTRARPLVRRLLSPVHASSFALATGVSGVSLLLTQVNSLTASLGLLNIILYAFVYTPLKRLTIANTWMGAVVGGIPPLMGWAACTGSLNPLNQPGAWALAGLLFAWQFPHFNSIAWTLRRDYARAGYRMMSVVNPDMNGRVGFRYSLLCFPICAAFSWLGVTSPAFAVLSCIPNGAMAWSSWRFWRSKGGRESDAEAKRLFWASIVHLPVVLALMMVCKTGLWDTVTGWFEFKGEEEKEEEQR
jgi:protoheme IX farnesyltransferase